MDAAGGSTVLRDSSTALPAAPTDAEIRPALRDWILARVVRDGDDTVLEELGLLRGCVRVDLVLVSGILHGFEIKSDRDSLGRLANQAEIYGKVLDRATLVVGERHLVKAMSIIPTWWGVIRVVAGEGGPKFTTIRRGRPNPRRDPRSLAELLWLSDAIALLEERDLAGGARGKTRAVVWDRLCRHFKLEEITAAVCAQLKARSRPLQPLQPA
jgi:hypothetical protein